MRGFAKVDGNQPAIVKALRDHGCSVQSLAAVGKGCPDILVGYQSRNYLFEIKDPQLEDKRRHEFTPAQVKWHDQWLGQAHKIFTADEAIQIIGEEDDQ